MKKIVAMILAVLGLATVLTACSPAVTAGEVADKYKVEEWTEIRQPYKVGDVQMPMQIINHPAKWVVTICDDVVIEGTEKDVLGPSKEHKCSDHRVSEENFSTIQIGDYLDFSGE